MSRRGHESNRRRWFSFTTCKCRICHEHPKRLLQQHRTAAKTVKGSLSHAAACTAEPCTSACGASLPTVSGVGHKWDRGTSVTFKASNYNSCHSTCHVGLKWHLARGTVATVYITKWNLWGLLGGRAIFGYVATERNREFFTTHCFDGSTLITLSLNF